MTEKPEPYRKLIVSLSILIPLAVAILFRVQIKGYDFSFLPPIYATINGLTAVLLLISYWAIRNKRVELPSANQQNLYWPFSIVSYHVRTLSYDECSNALWWEGLMKDLFLCPDFLICLSVAVVPLVLFTFSRALAGNFERHRQLAKFTFPIWLYVAITGVVAYLMISPYYSH